eukprot:scaffold304992_cov30-Tisochrysis_lutea.AAC.3
MQHMASREGRVLLGRVRVDASHKGRVGFFEGGEQRVQLVAEVQGDRREARLRGAAAHAAALSGLLGGRLLGGRRVGGHNLRKQRLLGREQDEFEKALCGVRDLPRKVADDESLVRHHLTAPGDRAQHAIRDGALLALLIKEGKEANGHLRRPASQHAYTCLIARLIDRVPDNGFAQIDFLFLPENGSVEVRLQRLVGEVDAQLLERVGLELLKTKDVEHANEGARAHLCEERGVDTLHEPVEELGVDRLGKSVARVCRLLRLERDLVDRVGERAHRACG